MAHKILRGGTVGATLAVALGLTSALAACGSGSSSLAGAGVGSSGAVAAASASPVPAPGSPSAPAKPTGGWIVPGGTMIPGLVASPEAQVGAVPPGTKLVSIEQIGHSSDGRTLYLKTEVQGGACGKYDVVLEESAARVAVGLAHLPVRVGVMCPNIVGIATFPVALSAPLGDRGVIDLATGSAAGGQGMVAPPANPANG